MYYLPQPVAPADLALMRKIGRIDRLRQVVHRPPADVQQRRLLGDGKLMVTVDHGFALSNPALVSACSKKSFSKASWPILACSGAKSTASGRAPPLNTSAAPSSNCRFQSLIWFGCTSNCSHKSANVFGGTVGQAKPIDLVPLHAKIGQLTLENDFLEHALTKAGLLSAKP